MIAPLRVCSPACPGWKVARVLGATLVVRCERCWAREVVSPGPTYYPQQAACVAALPSPRSSRAR